MRRLSIPGRLSASVRYDRDGWAPPRPCSEPPPSVCVFGLALFCKELLLHLQTSTFKILYKGPVGAFINTICYNIILQLLTLRLKSLRVWPGEGKSPFRVSALSFQYALIWLWAFLAFWQNKVFRAHLEFSLPSAIVPRSHGSFGVWSLEPKIWESGY